MNTKTCFDEEMSLEIAIWVYSLKLTSKNKKSKINKANCLLWIGFISDKISLKGLRTLFSKRVWQTLRWACQIWRDNLWGNSLIHLKKNGKTRPFKLQRKYLKSDLRLFCQQYIDVTRHLTREYILCQSWKNKYWCSWDGMATQPSWLHTYLMGLCSLLHWCPFQVQKKTYPSLPNVSTEGVGKQRLISFKPFFPSA